MPRRNSHANPNVPRKFAYNTGLNCDNKKRYKTELEAIATKEHQELVNMSLRLRVYKCNVAGCGGWHLTRAEDHKNTTEE
jgi:hypothetical protein